MPLCAKCHIDLDSMRKLFTDVPLRMEKEERAISSLSTTCHQWSTLWQHGRYLPPLLALWNNPLPPSQWQTSSCCYCSGYHHLWKYVSVTLWCMSSSCIKLSNVRKLPESLHTPCKLCQHLWETGDEIRRWTSHEYFSKLPTIHPSTCPNHLAGTERINHRMLTDYMKQVQSYFINKLPTGIYASLKLVTECVLCWNAPAFFFPWWAHKNGRLE